MKEGVWVEMDLSYSRCTVSSRHYAIQDGSCPFFCRIRYSIRSTTNFFFRLRILFPLPPPVLISSNQPFSCTFTLALFYHTRFHLSIIPMALARIRLPSFTLVLTSGPYSFYEYPTAIKLDSSVSPAMIPTAPDHLMVYTYSSFVT